MAEKVLNVVVKARDETADTFKGMQLVTNRLSSMFLGIGGAMLAMRGAAAAVAVTTQRIAVEMAKARGEAEDLLKAQMELERSNAEILNQIPLIGQAFKIAYEMESAASRAAADLALKHIQEVSKATESAERDVDKMRRDNLLLRAQLEGQSEADLARLRLQFAEEDRAKKLRDLELSAGQARALAADARAEEQNWRDYLARRQGLSGMGALSETYSSGMSVEEVASKLRDAQELAVSLDAAFNRARGAAESYRSGIADLGANERAKTEKDARDRAAQERKKDVEDTNRMLREKADAEQREFQASLRRVEEIRRARERAAEDEARRVKAGLDQEFELRQAVLRSQGKDREAEASAIKRKYEMEREEAQKLFTGVKDTWSLLSRLDLIDQAQRSELDALNAKDRQPTAGFSREVAVREQRFLKHTVGEEVPVWARTQVELQQRMAGYLETLTGKEPVTVSQEGLS